MEGPPWLEDSETKWPPTIDELEQTPESLTEVKKNTTVMVADVREECSIANVIDVNRYSSFTKLARVTAWVSRFVSNTRAQRNKQEKLTGQLEVSEVNRAEIQWIKVAQSELRTQGNFKQLVKELDLKEEAGIYRCRGRLVHSGLDVEAKTPIVLPKEHRVTNLLIERCHERVLHSGLRATLAEIRAKYWIPRGRQVVKMLLGRCVVCRRTAGKAYRTPQEAPLPSFRVQDAPPFSKVGVDFAGPLYVKCSGTSEMSKAYIALFSCCVTRAVHLELVEELSAPVFRLCLRRFTARRGVPTLIVSDNATTFVATAKAVKKLFSHPEIRAELDNMKIEWRLNLARAPWWGGFFERMVGVMKQCLKKS